MTKEELHIKAIQYANSRVESVYDLGLIQGFEDGAEWMKERVIEKAVEWIRTNWREYINGPDKDGCIAFAHWENDFRRAMEEEV